MTELDDAAQLRELCEKASTEYDGEKLIELVRKINELLDKTTDSKKNRSSVEKTELERYSAHFGPCTPARLAPLG